MVYEISYHGVPLRVFVKNSLIEKVDFIEEKEIVSNDVRFLKEFERFIRYKNSELHISFENLEPKIRQVLEVVYEIPYGKVTTYGEVSKKIFSSLNYSRFVGYALSKNPMPVVIPCHRVVASDLGLHGFSGGLKLKEVLLKIEGVEIKNGKVNEHFSTSL